MKKDMTERNRWKGEKIGGEKEEKKTKREEEKKAKKKNARERDDRGEENKKIDEQWTVDLADGTQAIVFPAKSNGETIGAAVQSQVKAGFSGPITIMVGFDKEGNIINYSVLSHTDTPGLGSKMPTWV